VGQEQGKGVRASRDETSAERSRTLSAEGAVSGLAPAETAGLAAALEAMESPAFVIWADGRVAFANGPGRAMCGQAPEIVAARLRAILAGRDTTFHLTRILAPGVPPHYLAVQHHRTADPGPRAAAAVARWGITPRQAEVLALLAKGKANKAIVALLAEQLSLRKSQIELISGETSSQKRFLIRGIASAELLERMDQLLQGE